MNAFLAGALFVVWIDNPLEAWASAQGSSRHLFGVALGLSLLVMVSGVAGLGRIVRLIRAYTRYADQLGKGELGAALAVDGDDDLGELGRSLTETGQSFKARRRELEEQNWLMSQVAGIMTAVQAETSIDSAADVLLSRLTPLVGGAAGAVYINEYLHSDSGDPEYYFLGAAYALDKAPCPSDRFRIGEGLVGQCARSRSPIILTDVPVPHVTVLSGSGRSSPLSLYLFPIYFDHSVLAVVEIVGYREFTDLERKLLTELRNSLALLFDSLASRRRTEYLLQESQTMTSRLQEQQDELTRSNEELLTSENRLRRQQAQLSRANRELIESSSQLARKASELDHLSRYRSAFVASVSDELRRPLENILTLEDVVSRNPEVNLTADQLTALKLIHRSGVRLARLLDDLVDLTRLEAGLDEARMAEFTPADLVKDLAGRFLELTDERGITLGVTLASDVPATALSDGPRVGRIVDVLVAHALEATRIGGVEVRLGVENSSLVIEVTNTGAGLPPGKAEVIAGALAQPAGSVPGQAGALDLGLTLCRRLALLLDARITVEDRPGSGTRFLLTVPVIHPSRRPLLASLTLGSAGEEFDDRRTITAGDRALLLVEEETDLACTLLELAQDVGFKGVVVTRADEILEVARLIGPRGIVLDLRVAGGTGEAIHARLREDPATASIPVQAIAPRDAGHFESLLPELQRFLGLLRSRDAESGDEPWHPAKLLPGRTFLVVDDAEQDLESLSRLLEQHGARVHRAASGSDALSLLGSNGTVDAVFMDLVMPGMDGFETTRRLRRSPGHDDVPVIALADSTAEGDREKSLEAGASDQVTKPVDFRCLCQILHGWIGTAPPARDEAVR